MVVSSSYSPGISSSSNLINASTSTGSPGLKGREQAIEVLIDSDPCGSFYRAARIVEDAVPLALGSRPNVITKNSLIEQAFALGVYEIDSIEKYDEAYLPDNIAKLSSRFDTNSSSEALVSVDSLTKERIINYHAKLLSEKQKKFIVPENVCKTTNACGNQKSSTQGVSAGGASGLVAALRNVFEEPLHSVFSESVASCGASFEMRQLLQSVSSHPMFLLAGAGSNNIGWMDEVSSESLQHKFKLQLKLEQYLLQLSKFSDRDKDEYLQGLIITILFLVTCDKHALSHKNVDDSKKTDTDDKYHATSFSQKLSDLEDLDALQLELQVGAILHLMPIGNAPKETVRNEPEMILSINAKKDYWYHLDPTLLSYFGESASVFEERLEIQKARMLARIQAPDSSNSSIIRVIPPNPVAVPCSSDTDVSGSPDADAIGYSTDIHAVAVETEKVVHSDQGNSILQEALEQVTHDALGERDVVETSDDAENKDDDDNDDDESSDDSADESGDEVTRNGAERRSGGSVELDMNPEQSDDDDLVAQEDSSSSSSESSSDEGEMVGSEQGIDTDDEDDAVLRQALAMSMADQEESTAEEGRAFIPSNESIEFHTRQSLPGGVTDIDDVIYSSENPVSRTGSPLPSSGYGVIPLHSGLDDDLSTGSLPPFPTLPHSFHFASAECIGSNVNVIPEDPDAQSTMQNATRSEFDPAVFTRFGSIPGSHVLLHLLRYTRYLVERRRHSKLSAIQRLATSSVVVSPVIRSQRSNHVDGSVNIKPTLPHNDASKSSVTLQLLVASFLLIEGRRSSAIEILREALYKEIHASPSGDVVEDSYVSSEACHSSGEEDDPALNFAMNYVEDDTPLSSESLENKGMRRKAAAAAHDHSAFVTSLKKQTEACKIKVKFYSLCLVHSTVTIRLFMQGIVRHALATSSAEARNEASTNLKFGNVIPNVVISKVSAVLNILTSSLPLNTFSAFDDHDKNEIFQEITLYKESILLWGECIPLLYPSAATQLDILMSTMDVCSRARSGENAVKYSHVSEILSLPMSPVETSIHKLQVLCRRLRTKDLLNIMISKPLMLVDCNVNASSSPNINHSLNTTSELPEHPRQASIIVRKVGQALTGLASAQTAARQLYLALCHRYHSSVLLFDGFFLTNEEVDESPRSTCSKVLSSGDTIRVNAEPSGVLQFDPTKCSDSIAILSATESASSVNQRASKVWGTVLSSHYYTPKTGIHRWAVRLDKCERGHVFIGVATAQASVRTYVGGDKYGWGMIGTQALWHDRRKIRGDFGSTFRTGSTIVVTLDTDAGTLSFSCWKDSGATSSMFSLDCVMTPKLHNPGGGIIEDWGIAFEGLPLDSRLFPAVGLYQRDDRVTLLSVDSSPASSSAGGLLEISGGQRYYPRCVPEVPKHFQANFAKQVQLYNSELTWDGMEYVADLLQLSIERFATASDTFWVSQVLPSLAASLCLIPTTVPILSTRFAVTLVPLINQCIMDIQRIAMGQNKMFPMQFQEGKWILQGIGSTTSSEFEEYAVDLNLTPDKKCYAVGLVGKGKGTAGKSKNGLVSITGCLTGSLLTFTEEWAEGSDEVLTSTSRDNDSSCVVSARLSLDGRKFEGIYKNVKYGTTGQLVGSCCENTTNHFTNHDAPINVTTKPVLLCETLLCLAQSHMLSMLGDDVSDDFNEVNDGTRDCGEDARSLLKSALSRPFLARSSLPLDDSSFQMEVDYLRQMYSPPLLTGGSRMSNKEHLLDFERKYTSEHSETTPLLLEQVSFADSIIAPLSGGYGSLRRLSPSRYTAARFQVICTFLRHSTFVNEVGHVMTSSEVSDDLIDVWRRALKILEDGVRGRLLKKDDKTTAQSCETVCNVFDEISLFLLQVEIDEVSLLSKGEVFSELAWFYQVIRTTDDLEYLRKEMNLASRRGILRLTSFVALGRLLPSFDIQSSGALEALSIGLPKQLGRGKEPAFIVGTKYLNGEGSLDASCALDGSYLSGLSGCCSSIRNAIRSEVMDLYQILMQRLNDALTLRETSMEYSASIDSSILALLAVFIGCIKAEDLSNSLFKRDIFDLLSRIFITYRRLSVSLDTIKAIDITSVSISSLQQILERDVIRAVTKCALAVTHVLSYQLSAFANNGGRDSSDMTGCLSLLIEELSMSISTVESASSVMIKAKDTKLSDKEFASWNDVIVTKKIVSSPEGCRESTRDDDSCLDYIKKHGVLHGIVLQGSAIQMGGFKGQPVVSNRGNSDSLSMTLDFDQQVLSQWLHVVNSVLRCGAFKETIASDTSCLKVLLNAVGFDVEPSDVGNMLTFIPKSVRDSKCLPSRFKSRIVRFLSPILALSKPSDNLVQGLFHLSGLISSNVILVQDDENAVSQELISLMRRLYLPTDSLWRPVIDQVIKSAMHVSSRDERLLCMKVGVLMFFSGSISSIDRGSYVLLKPSAAASLSPDHQPSAVGKSHPGGIGGSSISYPTIGATPHHVAGNGTENVITGLCRDRASAGIVSSIDIKNGTCEVILLSRDLPEDKISKDVYFGITGNDRRPLSNGWHGLTVRALQTPIGGTVLAQEVPLLISKSLPVELVADCIKSSLESLLLALALVSENEGVFSTLESKMPQDLTGKCWKPVHLSIDVMVVRTGIVLLSDKDLCRSFSSLQCCKEVFLKILSLALPRSGIPFESSISSLASDRKGMASLPAHESRYVYLLSMLKDINRRIGILEHCDENEQLLRIDALCSPGGIAAKPESILSAPGTSVIDGNNQNLSNQATETISENVREIESTPNQTISQSTGGNISEDDDENEAAATAAAHLREAAIAQMAELGLPRSWAELSLSRTGGINIEAAVTFCLERGGEMERLLAEERERDRMLQRDNVVGTARRRGNRDSGPSNHLLRQLLEMGFPRRWCSEALAVTGNNVDEALTWILNNGERLSEEDETHDTDGNAETEDADDDESADEEDDVDLDNGQSSPDGCYASAPVKVEEPKQQSLGWRGSMTPLSFLSGRASVDPQKMEISGLPTGGFSSIGTKGILLTSGKWYYEAILETAGCLQIGWADGSFAGHCHADRGDGCGDGPSSWAFDGWRRYRWHATATEWGCRWKEGDVVGCFVDMDDRSVGFTLNGKGEEIGMGVAFSGEGFRPCSGVYACVSFNRREKLRLILGGEQNEPFRYGPPTGFRGVGEAVLDAVTELDLLLSKERVLGFETNRCNVVESKRFLCDFSDGEHGHELMAWAHRYYGSDASVHLGSNRSKSIASKIPNLQWRHVDESVDLRVCKAWASAKETTKLASAQILAKMRCGHDEVEQTIRAELSRECVVMSILLARKLLLHIVTSMGDEFDPTLLVDNEMDVYNLWKVIDMCSSLRSAGWIGEAGAMAIAAEALGLGISSNDLINSRTNMERNGIIAALDIDESLFLPACCFTQLLTPVLRFDSSVCDTGCLVAADAEAAIGGEGGGLLTFLREALQSACCRSEHLRNVLVAAVRRSVRLLAVVEYEGEDFEPTEKLEDDDEEAVDKSIDGLHHEKLSGVPQFETNADSLPDARLTSFLTGLLLSNPVSAVADNRDDLTEQLFQAWSVGLLSASLPFRMVCAFTAAGVLNQNTKALHSTVQSFPTLAKFYGRLPSTITRRIWAERSSMPVCSRYVQAMIELLSSVRTAVNATKDLPPTFTRLWSKIDVDAATPLPVQRAIDFAADPNWESVAGWTSSDRGWELWSGAVEYFPVEWETPSRSNVRTLMDGGDGPPMLRENCLVVRGINWDDFHRDSTEKDEDGKNVYDIEKLKRDKEKQATEEIDKGKMDGEENTNNVSSSLTTENSIPVESTTAETSKVKKKKNKSSNAKLPLGTVISVESWNGVPAMARRIRWHLTGKEGLYRYGGDGGRFDLSHVETNAKQTRIKKRHPLPESREQCASRHGFGTRKIFPVLLRIKEVGQSVSAKDATIYKHEGILEWPDFGAGIRVNCLLYDDGRVAIEELELLFGSKHCGWESRFGQPSFSSGTVVTLSPTQLSSNEYDADLDVKSSTLSQLEELVGNWHFDVDYLRNPDNGDKIRVSSEMRLYRGRRCQNSLYTSSLAGAPLPSPLSFDREYHAPTLLLSKDGRTVSCSSSDGRGTAFASMGFTKGSHYWEVKLEQADIGSVFIGVAEKPAGSGSGSSFVYDSPARLNRWHGWGFVNFRATYTSGAERVYGSHCHAGDTVGVLLDCDAGRVSFFFDGLKYGEHILNDLGCAFENLSPFGFNVDGCGSGGAGQGAPSGFESGPSGRYHPAQGTIRPRTLWPVVGLRNQGDRVTISSKWISSYGVDGVATLQNITAVDSVLKAYFNDEGEMMPRVKFPQWFVEESYFDYVRWSQEKWSRCVSRGSGPFRLSTFGLDLELDASPLACASACASLGLDFVLLHGDRVRLKRSAGRILELAEEAIILGAYQGRLYYRIASQKSEGGSLTEGGGRAWCFDESEVVDGLPPILPCHRDNIKLTKISRFKCLAKGGLKVVYEHGAVVRSDIEIFDFSVNLGTIPCDTLIPRQDVIERRVNSCGVVRFRVQYPSIGEGWISARIRGGTEEPIVEAVNTIEDGGSSGEDAEKVFWTPQEAASAWFIEWNKDSDAVNMASRPALNGIVGINLMDFEHLISQYTIQGMNAMQADCLLAESMTLIGNHSVGGDTLDTSFLEVASAVSFGLSTPSNKSIAQIDGASPASQQAVAALFAEASMDLPSLGSCLARLSILRTLNRRARYALPWLSVRPCQEGSVLFGGVSGHGTSVDRAGRTRLLELQKSWISVSSIASRTRALRSLFFTSTKMEVLLSITDATTTPTPLSHDEYELPREIRTVRINRLKAGRAMLGDDTSFKRKYSVFAQLQSETRNFGASLRRGYVAKGHGGQRRAFKVKLIGEGVNDYSGPYREVFTDAVSEVLKFDANGEGLLPVLDPTPNNFASVGDSRDLFMFSVNGRDLQTSSFSTHSTKSIEHLRLFFASLLVTRDETSREVEEALVFLGRLAGTAFRHRIPLDLPLPLQSVWGALTEEDCGAAKKLEELDVLAHKQLRTESEAGLHPLLWWQQRMLSSFAEGLSNVIPVEMLPLLTGSELRAAICGSNEIDVELLKQVVEYEGYDGTENVIGYFWDALRGMSSRERKQFLQFVWARNRLPMRASDFEAPFKIQKDTLNSENKSDLALPSASTCFFSLTLPPYSSSDILQEKLLFAINNVTTMETDFQTNNAEIAEGYK